MIIKKVILNNFRNHEYLEKEFSNGVNLLSGPNGSGKTSILEAIGYALFGGKIRNSSLVDSVKEGEKKAKIYLEFSLGNDEFAVEKSIPSGVSKLISLDNSALKISGQKEIEKKLLELMDIKINSSEFFSNIILASQNKITDLFAGTPEVRGRKFDKIFNTEIYRQIADGIVKNYTDKTDAEINVNLSKIEEIKLQIIDSKLLENDFTELSQNVCDSDNHKSFLNNKIEELGKSIQELKDYKNQVENYEKLLDRNKSKISDFSDMIKKTSAKIKMAESASIIVQKTKVNYEKYNKLLDELKSIDGQIDKFEKIVRQNEKLIQKLNDSINKISNLKIEQKSISERLIELEVEKTNSDNKVNAQVKKILEYKMELDSKSHNIKKITDIMQKVEEYEKQIISNDEKIKICTYNITRYEDKIVKPEMLYSKIEGIKSELEILKEKFTQKSNFETQCSEINTRLVDNEAARNELSGGICPFLYETCKNISNGQSPISYFDVKRAKLEEEFASIKLKLNEYSHIDSDDKKLRRELSLLEEEMKDNAQTIEKLTKSKYEKEQLNSTNEKYSLQIQLLFSENKDFFVKNDFQINEYTSLSLSVIKNQISNQINLLDNNLFNLSNEHNDTKKEFEKKNNAIDALLKRNQEVVTQIEEEEKLKEKLNKDIEANKNEVESLDKLKEEHSGLKSEQEAYKRDYDEYLTNLKTSSMIEELISELKQYEVTLKEAESEDEKLSCLINENSSKYDENVLNLKSAEYEKLKSEYYEHEKTYSVLIHRLAELKAKIENNNTLIRKIEETKKTLSKLELKKEYSSKLRTYLKSMGQIIANKLLEKIQLIASDNFRMISGRRESIIWKSDSADAYQVALELENGRHRNFELLSGGEQMMVALSLRAAMNSILTNAKFAVFDEPTVNLDADRRKALSESLNQLLVSLDQAIIVTHDDTFREMANRVVDL